MKICYVGSLESIHTRRWAKFFADKGHEVHLLSPSDTSKYDIENVKVHTFTTFRTRIVPLDILLTFLFLPYRVLQFRALFRRISPDLVHVHYINDAAIFALLAGLRPFVVTAYGSDVLISPKKSWFLKQVVRLVLRRADVITCTGDYVKGTLIHLGAEPSKVHIIYCGTDTRIFRPKSGDPELRAKMGLHDSPIVISVRRLEPIYDVGSLVNSIPTVLERFPTVKFVIAHTGTEEDMLRRKAKSLGVFDSMRFLGEMPEEEMPRYLTNADIYVSTALSDGGLSAGTAEAMACGLPVIVTDVADNRQWVEEGVSGFLVPTQDPEAVAMRIIHLLEHEEERAQMGRNGRQVIVERNNWTIEMAKMEEIYQQLVQTVPG